VRALVRECLLWVRSGKARTEQIESAYPSEAEILKASTASPLFAVDLGPGRNDDGVDVRIWPSDDVADQPPAIIVQCKRQKEKVSKVVVKALYTDVVHHGSGLIVTTSTMSPGAKAVCEARKYPIDLADRATIRQWVSEMRKPGMGIVG
jgi:restriction system protein